jgi:hypothetical protein
LNDFIAQLLFEYLVEFYKERAIQEMQRRKAPKGNSKSLGAFTLDHSGKPIS